MFAAQVQAQVSICSNGSYTINSARPAPGASPEYRWLEAVNGNTGALIEGATAASYTVVANGKTPGTYKYVRQAYAADCGLWAESNVFTVQILGGALPAAAGTITGNTTVCAGTTATYSVPAIANADTYVWSLPSGASITAGTNTSNITVQFTAATTGNISVYGTNACGTGTASNKSITVNPTTAAAGTITGPSTVSINTSATYSVATIADAAGYAWTVNNATTNGSTSNSITVQFGGVATTATISVSGTNAYGCGNGAASSLSVQVDAGQQPGGTGTMQEFNPINYTTNSEWTLTDTRNNQSYKVRYLADGRFWMVQDLKYPDACNKTAFAGHSASGTLNEKIQGFYGDCRNNTQAGAGYLYDWMFAMQNAQAYYNSSWNPGCTDNGSSNAACRGICPEGWHLPTGNPTTGEFTKLNTAVNGGSTSSDAGLRAGSNFNGVYGGTSGSTGSLGGQGSLARYWSSSFNSTTVAYGLYFASTYVNPATSLDKNYGATVRCVRNY